MHECPRNGTPVLVVYESLTDGSVRRCYVCRWCDSCDRWPTWRRALQHRVRKEGGRQ